MVGISKIVPVAVAALGLGAGVVLWQSRPAIQAKTEARLPGRDGAGETRGASVDMQGKFQKLAELPAEQAKTAAAWPQFRGHKRDGVVEASETLTRKISTVKPVWSADLGEGYAGVVVARGRVWMLDYEHPKLDDPGASKAPRGDRLRCWSLEDGKELWRRVYQVDVKRYHGMSRTVPAVTEKYCVTLGPKCHVLCVDPDTGDYKWGKDLVREYGTKVPDWYAGQCPLIDKLNDKDVVVLAPGGEKVLMTALDAETGKVIWETPNDVRAAMSHASIVTMSVGEKRIYVYSCDKGLLGIDPADGKILWRSKEWKVQVAAASPVDMGGGRLFLSAGYGAGAAIMDITSGPWEAKLVKKLTPDEFGSEQHTPIFYSGHIFGVRQTDAQMICLNRDGKQMWASGPANRVGLGGFVIADNVLWAMSDTGTLLAMDARPDAFALLGKNKVMEKAHECWGPLALAGTRLLVRDLTRLVCLELKP